MVRKIEAFKYISNAWKRIQKNPKYFKVWENIETYRQIWTLFKYRKVWQKIETCSYMTQITLFKVEEKKSFVGEFFLQMNIKYAKVCKNMHKNKG